MFYIIPGISYIIPTFELNRSGTPVMPEKVELYKSVKELCNGSE